MRVLLIVLYLKSCVTFDIPQNNCKTDLSIDNDHYNVTESYDLGNSFPSDAHYDINGNLFFVESGRNLEGYYFNIKTIKANTTSAQEISGLPQGESYSVAVDKKNEKVYFGTSRGIFLYKHTTNEATLASDPDLRLNMLFIDKDGNKYITDSPDGVEELYLLAENKKIRFSTFEDLNEMAVDGDVSYEGYAQISFYRNVVYIASETLSYIHENDSGPLKLVKNIPGKVTAIAFDKTGNFVLGTNGKFLKYTKIDNNDCYHRRN
ncbi:hypothetical protein KGM_203245 [Danaus plexippus plexippus]|uniref:Ommochrome-binding protein-like n=1 Tax=Danaus plexippus plexippus TaxID=278856 RepID=A0A212FG85_DANPL|nr:hypothetical protein KGM_203245 [Danaus plexippus plexippus]